MGVPVAEPTAKWGVGTLPRQGESPLNAATILHQAYELLIPQGKWTKESWIDYASGEDQLKSTRVCSMGALALVEHLYAKRALYVYTDDVVEGEQISPEEDAQNGTKFVGAGYWDEGDEVETAVNLQLERDPEFAKATSLLADVIRDGRESSMSDVNTVVNWNDSEDTTLEEVKDVFQKAIEKARAL